MSTRKADPRPARPASPKRAGEDVPPPGQDASGIEGLFVDDLPRPAPRPRRKGSKEVSDKNTRAREKDKDKSKSAKSGGVAQKDARTPDGADSKEKRKHARAAERRRERGEAPGPVEGAPTSASLKRAAETPTPPATGFHTTGASGKLAYAIGVLQCERGPEEGLSLKLLEGDYTIGRARENSFVLKDIAASREHLRVRVQGNTCIALDQGSGNGTKVNGARIAEHVLKDGDKIEIGNSVLVYRHLGGEESKSSSRGVRLGTNPGVQRAATQERIVMAAERLAAELSERFRREDDDGLDDDPATNLERQGRARLAEKRSEPERPKPAARPQFSVVDNSEIAQEVRQMVEQVSRPDLARSIPPDMWGDSETETRFPSEDIKAAPSFSELARAPTRPPMPKAEVTPLVQTPRRVTPPPVPAASLSSRIESTPSGAGFPPIGSSRIPSRVVPGDGSSYVHKTRAVAHKERSRSVVLLTAVFVVLTLGISLGIAWVVLVDGNPRALFGVDRGDDTTTTGERAEAASPAGEPVTAKPDDAPRNDETTPRADKAGDDKAGTEKVAADSATTDKAASDKAASDKAASDKAAADKAAADKAAPDKAAPDKAAADKVAVEKAAADKAALQKAEAEKHDVEKREVEKREAEKREAEARNAKKAEARVEKKDPPRKETRREPAKERAAPEPKPEPVKAKPVVKSMDDGQAKSLVQQAVAGLKNDDYDEACPLLARVAKDAPDGSTWKLKAQNLQRARCQ